MIEQRSIFSNYGQKIVIVAIYMAIFGLFLYSPLIIQWLSPQKKTLNYYSFSGIVSEDLFQEFEEETGIHVYIKYFDTNEELKAQLKMTQGAGYDIVAPSISMVPALIQEGLLLPIHRSLLTEYKNIAPFFLSDEFEVSNRYSVPIVWTVNGMGVDKHYFNDVPLPTSLNALFAPDKEWSQSDWDKISGTYKVCMLDDPIDVFLIGAVFLYGTVYDLHAGRRDNVGKLLRNQKQWVSAYLESNLQYYLSGVVPVVYATSALMQRLMKLDDRFGFVLPTEGSIFTIENVAISRQSKSIKEAHMLIDFLLRKDSQQQTFDEYGYFPTHRDASDIVGEFADDSSFFPQGDDLKKLWPIHYKGLSLRELEQIWIGVRAA